MTTASTKRVLQAAVEAEMAHHLGYDKHDPTGRGGTTSKTVHSQTGQREIDIPRDQAGTFEPQIVRKRRRRLVREAVISLYGKG